MSKSYSTIIIFIPERGMFRKKSQIPGNRPKVRSLKSILVNTAMLGGFQKSVILRIDICSFLLVYRRRARFHFPSSREVFKIPETEFSLHSFTGPVKPPNLLKNPEHSGSSWNKIYISSWKQMIKKYIQFRMRK